MALIKCSFLVAVPAFAILGCGSSASTTPGAASDAGDASPVSPPNEAGLVEAATADAATLAFSPANIPAGTVLVAPGDWVFSTQTCGGRSAVQIDTSMGTSDCDGAAAPYTYAAITQSNASLGSLQAALFVTNKFTVQSGMTVTVVGNLPLIVLALGDVSISGALAATVNSLTSSTAYAGGSSGPASAANGAGGNGPGGGAAPDGMSGGGGGGFCGTGGSGLEGGDSGIVAAGGKAYGDPTNVPLLAGSSGASGSDERGGGGGGAIQIDSATSIQVTALGAVNVGGGGGGWAQSGGGSGGAILFEAPAVTVTGTLAANGGGGAESYINNSGQNGQASASPAAGGMASPGTANAGGNGSGAALVNGASGGQSAGTMGGGGGGGAGRIRINTSSGAATIASTAVVSPQLTPATMPACATQGTLAPPL